MNGRSWDPAKWACVFLVTALVLTVFVGLSPRAAGVDATGRPLQQTESTLVIGSLQQPDSLNTFAGVLTASYDIWAHVYELLVGIGNDLTPVPALAQSWSVDATNKIWTFNLVRNATWHDDTPTDPRPFTAEDVNFTFRYIYPATPLNPIGCDLGLLQGYLGDSTKKIGVDVDNITVLDPYTIRIPTYQPKANILSMFIQILPKHIWGPIACNRAGNIRVDPIGTGMYKFVTWVQGTYIQLDLDTKYWRLDPNEDYVDHIIYQYYGTQAGLFSAFRSGAIDGTYQLNPTNFLQTEYTLPGSSTPNVGKFVQDAISYNEVGACLASDPLIAEYGKRGGRNWLLTNTTVRVALQHAVDRQYLVDTFLLGLGKPGETLVASATPFWHYEVPLASQYQFDLNRARELLNDPKGDGAPLKVGFTTPGDFGQNIDPAAPENQDAFIDTTGDGTRDVVNAAEVVAGDDAGASIPNSNVLSFTISVLNYATASSDAADQMISWWRQIGVTVTKSIVTESRMISITYDCSEDMYIWGWGGDVDPDFILSVMTKDQILNWQDAWYYNKTYDQWYRDQQQQVDAAERQQTIWNMQKQLYEKAAYLIMWYDSTNSVVRTDRFTGWGDWNNYTGLGFAGYGNDFLMLTLRAGAPPPTNQCPTTPLLIGTLNTYTNVQNTYIGNATDPEDDPLSWTFSWGEGSTTVVNTLAGVTEATADWIWPTVNTYDVTVTVSDGKCGSLVTSNTLSVTVNAPPAVVGWLNGTVWEAGTTTPINGSLVTAVKVGTTTPYSDTTDTQGRYSLPPLAPGEYVVTASKALYRPEVATGVMVVADAETVVNFNLTAQLGWIAGTVSDSSTNAAIANATVRITGGVQEQVARTDAQGRYNKSMSLGTYRVEASHPDYKSKNVTGILVEDRVTASVNFVLDPLPKQVAPQGLDPVLVAGIGIAILVVIAGVAAFLMRKRRKKEEEIIGPSVPPQAPPRTPGPP